MPLFIGQIISRNKNHLYFQNDDKDSYDLGVYPCHEYAAASQFFSFSKAYELRREDSCAEVAETAGPGIEPVRMRQSKIGFSTPQDEWFRDELRDFIESTIRSESFATRPFFQPDRVRALLAEHIDGQRNDYCYRRQ